ncbi:MAG: formylglycine-generating enzyme family protein [Acidobacteriota bacterium]
MTRQPRAVVCIARGAACAAALAVWVSLPVLGTARLAAGVDARAAMVRIPAGSYVPLYAPPAPPREVVGKRTATWRLGRSTVAGFDIDLHAVTNGEFLEFVTSHPEWRRSRVKSLFADASYLHHWRGDLELGDTAPRASPVVYVSWFAARAYLRAAGKRLPTVDQWEYVAAASETRRDASRDPMFLERLRVWYGQPTLVPLPAVGSGLHNIYGVRDLHGLIWEWTEDFNSSLVTGESRADSSLDRGLYCGSGAAGASDFKDYASFMRVAFRSSLEARYTVGNLGFRGVAPIPEGSR